jgi:nitrogen fixation NifU-like protein
LAVPPIPEPQLDDLYRELILDHYRNPRNRRALDDPKLVGEGYNPLCGDEIEVHVRLEGDVVSDIGFTGRGCSISQASGSMMTEALKGKSLEDVRSLIAAFTRMMTDPDYTPPAELGDLEALQGVAKYPVRVKCATLAWHALEEGLNQRGGR